MGILSTRNMSRRGFARAGRGRMDDFGDVRVGRSLRSRDDDPSLPDDDDDDDDDDLDSAGPDTDTEDDDEPATGTTALLTAAPSPTSIPILSSSTRSIPTLTAIAHTPTFPSSTTTARAVKAMPTSASTSTSVGLTTITSTAARQSSISASSLIVTTTTTGSALFVSASNQPMPSSDMRPQQHNNKPMLGRPSGHKLSPGAIAGIAIGTIAAVALLAALGFLMWKRRSRRRVSSSPRQPHDSTPPNPRLQPANVRSQSEILNELMASAYATQNGSDMMSRPYPNEKMRPDTSSPPAPSQPQIRRSIASWLRRHHPLDLNPPGSRRSSSTASTPRTTISDVNELSPPQPQPAQRKHQDQTRFVSVWSDSTPTDSSSSSGGSSSVGSFYGRDRSRHFSDSIRGTWILPARARSFASRDGDGGGGGGEYV